MKLGCGRGIIGGAEPLAGRSEDRYVLSGAEQGFGESCRVIREMLAIVENDENATILDCRRDPVDRRFAMRLPLS